MSSQLEEEHETNKPNRCTKETLVSLGSNPVGFAIEFFGHCVASEALSCGR
jgi:hypothetical protein